MVHVVIAEPPYQQAVEAQVSAMANGWQRLERGTWIMGSHLTSGSLRDILRIKVPGASLVVMRLHGQWGTSGMSETAEWLQSAASIF